MSDKFLRSEVQEKGVSVLRVIDTGNTLPGMGERLCILLCPWPLLFYSNFITGISSPYLHVYLYSKASGN